MYGDDNIRYKAFTRRTAILAGGKIALLSVLVGRMYQLQVIESDKYKTLADDNRISLRLLSPQRGRILDRFGEPLAANQENYRVILVAEQAGDVGEILDEMSQIVPIADHDKQRVLREVRRRRKFFPVTVRENLDWKEVAKVEVNALDLPGVSIDVGQSRVYPDGEFTAHILGYVGAVSESELTGDPLLEIPGFKIGKNGIERVYDKALRGKAGSSQVEVNALGRVIKELSRKEGESGNDMILTLDARLQRFAMRRLAEERSAASVVVDIHNGDVLALASSPSYDPNAFATGLSTAEWRALVNDPRTPLINKAIAGHYAPGSTFKMIVALAALNAGVITQDQKFFCRGSLTLGNAKFHCWKRWGHGWMDLHSAIQQSCDVYFYEIARKVGVDRIAEMANKFGLGHKLGIDLPGEKPGLIPTRAWKRAETGVAWQQGETLVTGIGQGFVLATPLQLAVMTARLSNGGFAIKPRLVEATASPDDADPQKVVPVPKFPKIDVSQASLRAVLDGMNAVTNSDHGTARRARIEEEGKEMAGKTGTAQVRRITKRERDTGVLKNDERPWRERDHALFVGFAPVHRPQYAVSVIVEHGGGGSSVAAPIARDLLLEVQRHDPAGRGIVADGKDESPNPVPVDDKDTAQKPRRSKEG